MTPANTLPTTLDDGRTAASRWALAQHARGDEGPRERVVQFSPPPPDVVVCCDKHFCCTGDPYNQRDGVWLGNMGSLQGTLPLE